VAPADGDRVSSDDTPERFLARSFRILDAGDYRGWLELCTPDIAYVVTTRLTDERGYDSPLILDDLAGLERRIGLMERMWHAEEPPTRTLHVLTNVELEPRGADEVLVHACFTVVATRRERQSTLYGRYRDVLRVTGETWRLAARTATLERNLLEIGNITFIV
jgi:3-phenylpropionate/cinnamic acid dioxygenase small subunit